MIYKYESRYIVEYSNKSRASFSKGRYGPLIDLIAKQSEKLDYKIFNPYKIVNDILYVYYWDQRVYVTKVIKLNKDNFGLLRTNYWQLNCNGYVWSRTGGGKSYLHQIVIGEKAEGKVVDHINHNPLDNRRENLRLVEYSVNSFNRTPSNKSGVTGVNWDPQRKLWRARINYHYKEYSMCFTHKEDAIAWRKEKEEEFANNVQRL